MARCERRWCLLSLRVIFSNVVSFQQALVWWKAPVPPLHALDPRLPIHAQITSQSFSLQNSPIAQDTSAHTHALALEAALGGPDLMASRVGTCAHPSLVAAQLLRVREAWPDIWARTGRVQMASSFLASLFTGQMGGMGEAEASSTGLWVHAGNQTGVQSHWDEGVMEIVGGNREEGRRIWAWLGDVDASGGRKRIGTMSRYLVERYGFDPGLLSEAGDVKGRMLIVLSTESIITPFTSDYLSSYLSLCPSPSDAVLAFGPMDSLMAPAPNYIPTRLYNLYPHPAQDASEKKRYIVALSSRYVDVASACT